MKNCQQHHDLIAAQAAGDIDARGAEDLQSHTLECADCRGLVELHRSIATLAVEVPEPADEAFANMRQCVLEELEARGSFTVEKTRGRRRAAEGSQSFWHSLADLFVAHPVATPVSVVLVLAVAGLPGRGRVEPGWTSDSMLRAVQEQAEQSKGLIEFWNAPFTFSNVVMNETESGSLALGFDACRYVETEASRRSALARELFMATIVDSPVLGVRMKAMELAPSRDEPGLQEALIYSMHGDADMAVRMQALRALGRNPLNAFTQDALLKTLREDTAVPMRLLALETLAAGPDQIDPAVIRRAVSEAGQATDGVIMQRTVELIGD